MYVVAYVCWGLVTSFFFLFLLAVVYVAVLRFAFGVRRRLYAGRIVVMCAPHALRVSYRAVARARTQSIAQSVVLLQVCTARRQRCCGGCVDAVAVTRAAPRARARQVGASRGGPRLAARFVPTLAFMRRLGRFVAVCMTGDILVRGRALASACVACSPMGHAHKTHWARPASNVHRV